MLAALYDTDLKNKKKALLYYKKFLSSNPKPAMQKYITYTKSRISVLN